MSEPIERDVYDRWYDQDPALKQALESLRQAPDKYQAQIALNIIMVIVEHKIENHTLTHVDELLEALSKSRDGDHRGIRRWYDVNETLRSAMQMLNDCPEDVQQHVIPMICQLIEDALETQV